jgi:hypothetical protein
VGRVLNSPLFYKEVIAMPITTGLNPKALKPSKPRKPKVKIGTKLKKVKVPKALSTKGSSGNKETMLERLLKEK